MITLDPASELFLANMDRIQQRLAEANRQVASGKRIGSAADAPDQVDTLLQLRADRQRNTQILANLSAAKTDVNSADHALAASVKLMDRALVLASQGSNFTQTAETRQSMALEVQSLLEQMVAYSQTAVQGRFIFSGDQADSPAYSYGEEGVTPLIPTQISTSRIEDPAGGSFAASKTAREIFDSPNGSESAFAALDNLQQSLEANDPDLIAAAVDPIRQASTHLNSMATFYGHVENRIQGSVDFADGYNLNLSTQVGQLEDADIAAAAMELSLANTQLQAAFQMRAKMRQTSLFDYLG